MKDSQMKRNSLRVINSLALTVFIGACGGTGGDTGTTTQPIATTPSPSPAPGPSPAPAPGPSPVAAGNGVLKTELVDGSLSFIGEIGSSSIAKKVSISNTGTGPASLRNISIGSDFAIVTTGSTDCVAGASLAAGQTCFVNVTSRPQAYGIKQSSLSIESNASVAKIDLPISANAYPTTPVVLPNSLVTQLGSSYNPVTRTMVIDVRKDCVADSERIFNVQRWSFYRSTGLYAPPGIDIEITTGAIPTGTNVKAVVGLWQQATGNPATPSVDPTEFALLPNTKNIVRSTYGGPIYLRATNNINPSGSVTFTVGATAQSMPTLFLGRNTYAQWVAQLNATSVTPYAEVVGKRTIITFDTNKIKEALAGDPNADMTKTAMLFEEMLNSHDYVAGLDDTSTVHAKQQQPLHFTPHQISSQYMFATYYRTAFCYDCAKFLFTNDFMVDGWGPWHEAGHMYQGAWEWGELSEVSVNLYSLEFEKRIGRKHRLIADGGTIAGLNKWDSALQTRTKLAKFDDLEVFERLVMFEQLTLKFGRDFWSKIHRYYRDPATRPSGFSIFFQPAQGDARRQAFIISASKIAGLDLRDFFDAWALKADSTTNAAVSALALPKVNTAELLALRPQ
jgi:hypothetical protein